MDDNKSRDHFTFFRSFREQIDLCNEHDQLRLYRAISDFALFHKDTEFDEPLLNMAWIGIKPFLEKSWTNYTNGIRSKGVPKPGMCGNKNAKKQSENKANSKPIQSENKTIGMECNGMDSIVEDNNKETDAKKDVSLIISPEYSNFLKWLNINCPHLLKMEIPTEVEYKKLLALADGSKTKMTDKLLAMENDKKVPRNRRSIYRTCLEWLKRDKRQ